MASKRWDIRIFYVLILSLIIPSVLNADEEYDRYQSESSSEGHAESSSEESSESSSEESSSSSEESSSSSEESSSSSDSEYTCEFLVGQTCEVDTGYSKVLLPESAFAPGPNGESPTEEERTQVGDFEALSDAYPGAQDLGPAPETFTIEECLEPQPEDTKCRCVHNSSLFPNNKRLSSVCEDLDYTPIPKSNTD